MSSRTKVVAASALLVTSIVAALPMEFTRSISARSSSLRGGAVAACYTAGTALCPNGGRCAIQPCDDTYHCAYFIEWLQKQKTYASAVQTSTAGVVGTLQGTAIPCEVEWGCYGCTPAGTWDYGNCMESTGQTADGPSHNIRVPTSPDAASKVCSNG